MPSFRREDEREVRTMNNEATPDWLADMIREALGLPEPSELLEELLDREEGAT